MDKLVDDDTHVAGRNAVCWGCTTKAEAVQAEAMIIDVEIALIFVLRLVRE